MRRGFKLAEVFSPHSASKRKVAFTLAEVFSPHSAGKRKVAFTLAEVFSPHSAGKRKAAFTLAEVLITLGIIGVVAALTLPTLVQNHRKKEVVTKLQKIYSIMNQAINMSVAEYGDAASWFKDCGISSNKTCTNDETMEWFDQYIGKHLQIIKKEKIENTDNAFPGILVYLKDGSLLFVSTYLYDMDFYLNEKAFKNPETGRNHFRFRYNPALNTGQDATTNTYTIKSSFEPYTGHWRGTREDLITGTFGCSPAKNKGYCSKLIQYDGWQISDDYPIKF